MAKKFIHSLLYEVGTLKSIVCWKKKIQLEISSHTFCKCKEQFLIYFVVLNMDYYEIIHVFHVFQMYSLKYIIDVASLLKS